MASRKRAVLLKIIRDAQSKKDRAHRAVQRAQNEFADAFRVFESALTLYKAEFGKGPPAVDGRQVKSAKTKLETQRVTAHSETNGLRVIELARSLLEEAAGGPLTVDEMTKAMIDRGKRFRSSTPRDSIQTILKKATDQFEYRDRRWYLKKS